MNLFTKQNQTHRLREHTQGYGQWGDSGGVWKKGRDSQVFWD